MPCYTAQQLLQYSTNTRLKGPAWLYALLLSCITDSKVNFVFELIQPLSHNQNRGRFALVKLFTPPPEKSKLYIAGTRLWYKKKAGGGPNYSQKYDRVSSHDFFF